MHLTLVNKLLLESFEELPKLFQSFLVAKYIQVPTTEKDVNNQVKNFYEQHGFPQCLGAIDGAHIRIKQPSCSACSDYVN